MPSQAIKIPVKKADGSIVHMTPEEFQKYRSSGVSNPGSTKVAPDKPVSTKVSKIKKKSPASKDLGQISDTPKKNKKKTPFTPMNRKSSFEKEKSFEELLAELKKKNKASKITTSKALLGTKKKTTKELAEVGEQHLSTTTPVKDIFLKESVAEAEAAKRKREEAKKTTPQRLSKAFLKGTEKKKDATGDSIPRVKIPKRKEKENDLTPEQIVSKLSFNLDAPVEKRMVDLIDSLQKGLRDKDRFRNYALREVGRGGLGISPLQVKEILDTAKGSYIENKAPDIPRISKERAKELQKMFQEKRKELKAAKEEYLAEKATKEEKDLPSLPSLPRKPIPPVKPQGKKEVEKKNEKSFKIPKNLKRPVPPVAPNSKKEKGDSSLEKNFPAPAEERAKPSSKEVIDQLLQREGTKSEAFDIRKDLKEQNQNRGLEPAVKAPEVSMPKKESVTVEQKPAQIERKMVGPVEEMKLFNLEDFRRIGNTPKEARLALLKKFQNIQAESYMNYIEAVDAFKHSPLFFDYVSIAEKALHEGITLSQYFSRGIEAGIKEDEFFEILEMNKKLVY